MLSFSSEKLDKIVLDRLAVLGNAWSQRWPGIAAKADPMRAPLAFTILGGTRHAYLAIRSGADPLESLLWLESLVYDLPFGDWPELSLLIDRLIIELDTQ